MTFITYFDNQDIEKTKTIRNDFIYYQYQPSLLVPPPYAPPPPPPITSSTTSINRLIGSLKFKAGFDKKNPKPVDL